VINGLTKRICCCSYVAGKLCVMTAQKATFELRCGVVLDSSGTENSPQKLSHSFVLCVLGTKFPSLLLCEQIPGVYFEAHRRQNSRSVYYARTGKYCVDARTGKAKQSSRFGSSVEKRLNFPRQPQDSLSSTLNTRKVATT
jgi:hypothetical protein